MRYSPYRGAGEKLIARYIHSGNKEIPAVTLDKTTGIWTTSASLVGGLGLTVGTIYANIVPVNKNFNNNNMPREFKAVDNHYIEVLSDSTFYVNTAQTTAGRILSYPDANTPTDVSAITFEIFTVGSNGVSIDISSFDIREMRAVFSGIRNRPSWSYIYLNGTYDGGTANNMFLLGSVVDGRDFLHMQAETYFKYVKESGQLFTQSTRYLTRTWTETNGTWGTYAGANAASDRNIVLLKNFKATSVRFAFSMANNSVIELYDAGGVL